MVLEIAIERSRSLPISGKMIQEKALLVAAEFEHTTFAASNGWLRRWQERHNVKSSILSGESADVKQQDVDDWKKRLPMICDGFNDSDIFNADETALFYRQLPSKSMTVKGEATAGIELSKDRITVLFATSMTGEKLKPLIIGRSANHWCFRGTNIASLGVYYFSNRRAWMTSKIFTQWLYKINNKFKKEGRKSLLFIDSCPSHAAVDLSNVKIQMLPPNTTARLQPCDAGIIRAYKLQYRRTFLQQILFKADSDETATATEISKSVSLLNAIIQGE